MRSLDVRDLSLLEALSRTGSVSATAGVLGMSQPSVSLRLGKLREHFEDALFVRTTNGMKPTPRALALAPAVRSALALFEGVEGSERPFDPATSDRLFRICMTNTGQMVVLARLLNRIHSLAPSVRVEVIELDAATPSRLQSGDADLAMGFTVELQAGFYQQNLFTEHYVCLLRRDHPRITGAMTKRQFLAESHVAVKTAGTSHWTIEKAMSDNGISRRIALWVPSFLGLGEIVANTDLLALAPIHLASALARDKALRHVKVPFPMDSYGVRQFWHERFHRDGGNRWLREVCVDVLAERSQPVQRHGRE